MARQCTVQGCARDHAARGYCFLHYDRVKRTGEVGSVGVIRNVDLSCAIDGCERRVRYWGMCGTHAERVRLGRDVSRPVGPYAYAGPTCSMPGCDRSPKARGLCGAHYLRPDDPRPVGSPGRPPIHGMSEDPYGPGWHAARKAVRVRDGGRCRCCGRTEAEEGRRLAVAHLVPAAAFPRAERRLAHHPSNLVLLCAACHSRFDNATETRWNYASGGGRREWPGWVAQEVGAKVDWALDLLEWYAPQLSVGRRARLVAVAGRVS